MVLIFSGTTEGRLIAQFLSRNGVECDVCVATEYGSMVMPESDRIHVRVGRLSAVEMRDLCQTKHYQAVIDATHPFAVEVTENIRDSFEGKIPLFRFFRNIGQTDSGNCVYFPNAESCFEELKKSTENIFLTTGSKNLKLFCSDEALRKRITARVLPGMESLKLCYEAGLEGRQIIAMQGPFSVEMNAAQFHDYHAGIIVTKESGKTGGLDEKILAAEKCGSRCYVIRGPESETNSPEFNVIQDYGVLFESLEKILNKKFEFKPALKITLAGIGMGNPDSMTLKVHKKVENADYIFGAERMINDLNCRAKKFPYYLASDILPVLKEIQKGFLEEINVVVLFSGDTGFYSGASKLKVQLEVLENSIVEVLPGISSIQYMAARTGVSWQNVKTVSAHGVEDSIWKKEVKTELLEKKCFFMLTSGADDVKKIVEFLKNHSAVQEIWAGFNLSYENEKIIKLNFNDDFKNLETGLYTLFVVVK